MPVARVNFVAGEECQSRVLQYLGLALQPLKPYIRQELFLPHCSTENKSRDEEKTVLKELVPMLACLNSSGAGTSLF